MILYYALLQICVIVWMLKVVFQDAAYLRGLDQGQHLYQEKEIKKEIWIRRLWLIGCFAIPFSLSCVLLLCCLICPESFLKYSTGLQWPLVGQFSISVIMMGYFLWGIYLPYYCAIRKSGTVYLLLLLISGCLGGFFAALERFFSSKSNVLGEPGVFEWSLFLYFMVCSYMLRRVNQRRQKRKKEDFAKSDPEFLVAIEKMHMSDSLQQLRQHYKECLQEWPHMEQQITKHYHALDVIMTYQSRARVSCEMSVETTG